MTGDDGAGDELTGDVLTDGVLIDDDEMIGDERTESGCCTPVAATIYDCSRVMRTSKSPYSL